MEYAELLDVALDAARAASAIHQRHVGRVSQNQWSAKGNADFVSYVDGGFLLMLDTIQHRNKAAIAAP